MKSLKESIEKRRSIYAISNQSPISDTELEGLIKFAATHVPSAFNSQSTRLVLLLGDNHKKFWDITKDALRKIVPKEAFAATEQKIDSCFAAGYGTVLYFEDQTVVESLQKDFPLYANNFPVWSQHTSAMHQFAVWNLLEEAGLGATLQHYNPLIDEEVRKTWNLPASWTLIAEMPFGTPVADAGEKTFQPIEDRVKIFK
ncbi:MAG: nitroreductase family protein [Bacteroidales bacterium]|nr:nitroreductase family protein [Bacteroidales bacterium]